MEGLLRRWFASQWGNWVRCDVRARMAHGSKFSFRDLHSFDWCPRVLAFALRLPSALWTSKHLHLIHLWCADVLNWCSNHDLTGSQRSPLGFPDFNLITLLKFASALFGMQITSSYTVLKALQVIQITCRITYQMMYHCLRSLIFKTPKIWESASPKKSRYFLMFLQRWLFAAACRFQLIWIWRLTFRTIANRQTQIEEWYWASNAVVDWTFPIWLRTEEYSINCAPRRIWDEPWNLKHLIWFPRCACGSLLASSSGGTQSSTSDPGGR